MAARRLVVECQSRPLDIITASAFRAEARKIADAERRGDMLPILFPPDAYTYIFLRRADFVIEQSIRTLLDNERRRVARGQFDSPGVIYAFWISGEPTNRIKIGRSVQRPHERMSEWNRMLASDGARVINQLFAFKTRYNSLSERIIHTTLACEHLAKLRHPISGNALTEFYDIDNVMALRLFVALCVRYADTKGDEIKALVRK